MIVTLRTERIRTLEEVKAFLDGSDWADFRVSDRREAYDFITLHGTRASSVSIGTRRRPRPEGQPGFLRIDAVHLGD